MHKDERQLLLKNIQFIIDSGYGGQGFEEQKRVNKKALIEKIGISYVTYLKLKKGLGKEEDGYTPQDGTLSQFVKFFNGYWTPGIDISMLKRKDLMMECDLGKLRRKELAVGQLDWYCGSYFCYYYTKRSEGLRMGVLDIYCHRQEYYVQMILGFYNAQELDRMLGNLQASEEYRRHHREQALEKFFGNHREVSEKYKKFLESCEEKDRRYYYYSGTAELYAHSLLLNLFPEDHSYKKMIAFKRQHRSSQQQYQGGLGAELALAHEIHSHYSNTLRLTGISRKYIEDFENVGKLLQIEKEEGLEILDLSTDDYRWFNLAIGRTKKEQEKNQWED